MLGSLLALAVALMAWKTSRIWLWLQQREAVAWVVLGLLWWLALKPGAFGLVLIAWGALNAVRILKAPVPSLTDKEPSPSNS
jgi:hypothetical protein